MIHELLIRNLYMGIAALVIVGVALAVSAALDPTPPQRLAIAGTAILLGFGAFWTIFRPYLR